MRPRATRQVLYEDVASLINVEIAYCKHLQRTGRCGPVPATAEDPPVWTPGAVMSFLCGGAGYYKFYDFWDNYSGLNRKELLLGPLVCHETSVCLSVSNFS